MNRIEHREEKYRFPFVEYSPVNSDKKLPLIVQLHGAGERGNGTDDLSLVEVHGFSEIMKENEFECILVMPQCPLDSFWGAKCESLISFIQQIKETHNVDEDRVYLTGYSMGGNGTWFTAMAKPDLFAAIAPVCGVGMAWNASCLTMPVWIFHGANDTVVSTVHSDEMAEKLKNNGTDVIYSRVDGIAHAVWNYAYKKELLEWLLSQKRK